MGRRLAISDIHGCCKTFKQLLKQLELTSHDSLFLLGDYIDRGPDSKGVLDHILELRGAGYSVRCLRGNHEQLLLKGLQGDDYMLNVWQKNGGLETLNSYNLYDPEKIPDAHYDFLKSTEFYIELPDYILVHAGLNMEILDFRTDTDAMMWIRKFEPIPEKIHYKPVVHGHTPISIADILNGVERIAENYRLDIDNGCVYSRKGGGGLVAFDLDTRQIHRTQNCE
jgi:serine/threonine protein phosphatase 1